MASLTVFQVLELNKEKYEHPTLSSISGDALTLIVASTLNLVHVYRRESLSDKFVKRDDIYSRHDCSEQITALAIQDSGVHAASGDDSGAIHIWRTDDPRENAKYIFNKGRITAISISTKFMLACFSQDSTNRRKMLLVKKGLNIKEKIVVEKEYEGDMSFDRCSVSEYGKPASPHLMYMSNGNLVFEYPLQKGTEVKRKLLQHEAVPWCIRRNSGAGNLFVVSAASFRNLILWAPLHGEGEQNPIKLKMSSEESLRLNVSLVMSSVISSAMFMASIYEEKVNILKVVRRKSAESVRMETKSKLVPPEPLKESDEESDAGHCIKQSIDNLEEKGRNNFLRNALNNSANQENHEISSQEVKLKLDNHPSEESLNQIEFEPVKDTEAVVDITKTIEVEVCEKLQQSEHDREKDASSSISGNSDNLDPGSVDVLGQDTETSADMPCSNKDAKGNIRVDPNHNPDVLAEEEQNGFGTEKVEAVAAACTDDFLHIPALDQITSHRFWDLFYEEQNIHSD